MIRVGELTASYVTVDPATGLVGADFTGLVNALGLILPGSQSSTPQPQNRIVWTRTSDGAIVADVVGWNQGPEAASPQIAVEARATTNVGAAGESIADLNAVDDVNTVRTQLEVRQTSRGATGTITGTVPGNAGFAIMDSNDGSNFFGVDIHGGERFYQVHTNAGAPWTNNVASAGSPIPVSSAGGNGEVTVNLNHALGIANLHPVHIGMRDGSFAAGVSYRYSVTDNNNISFVYRNPSFSNTCFGFHDFLLVEMH